MTGTLYGAMQTTRTTAALVATALALAGCSSADGGRAGSGDVDGEPAGYVERDDFGDAWPLTVDSGRVRCEPYETYVFVGPGGTEYALNGLAETEGYADIEPIWRDDPDPPVEGVDLKVSIDPLMQAASERC